MIEYEVVRNAIRSYVLDDAPEYGDMAHNDEELDRWIIQAGFEILNLKRHLCVDKNGEPRNSSEVIGDTSVDFPQKYFGALMHGALMFAFSEDQQRSSFERGQFYAQLGLGGKR